MSMICAQPEAIGLKTGKTPPLVVLMLSPGSTLEHKVYSYNTSALFGLKHVIHLAQAVVNQNCQLKWEDLPVFPVAG